MKASLNNETSKEGGNNWDTKGVALSKGHLAQKGPRNGASGEPEGPTHGTRSKPQAAYHLHPRPDLAGGT